MLFQLKRSITLATSLENAWEFFSDPKNLKVITPPKLNMKIISELEGRMYPGQIITYKVHPFFSIPLLWVTEITQVEEPNYFVDEQRYGPYRLWHHQHRFRAVEGGTVAEDIVDYIMPAGPLGVLMQKLFVKHQLNFIFDYRNSVLKERFGVV